MQNNLSAEKQKENTRDWEKEYHELNKRYRELLDNIGDSYTELDLTGTATFINDKAHKTLGYSEEEIIGIKYKNFMSPETAEKLFNIYNTVYKTGQPAKSIEYDMIAKDGTPRFVRATVILRRDDSGNPIGFASIKQDITEKKRAEIALKESEEKYRSILENIGDAYAESDLSGTITFLNDNAKSILGYDRAEFVGMNYKQFSSPENTKKLFEIFNDIYKTGKPNTKVEYELIAKDGSSRIIEAYVDLHRNPSGEIIGFKTVSRDITQQKKAEIELKKSEEKYRNILENMYDGYTETDLYGKSVFMNKISHGFMGYTKEEFTGMNYKDYITPESAKKVFDVFHEVYKTGKTGMLVEYDVITKNGSMKSLEANVSPKRDASGKPIGFTCLTRDITERKQQEAEKKKLEAQLHQAQKMEAIGTLAGGIAHDFNNLLMSVLGLNSLMLADTKKSHPHYEYLTEIETHVKNAVGLTRQLLGFARGGKYEVKATDINDLLKTHNHLFGRTKKEITITETYEKNIRTVEVDRGQMSQVLVNIYLNAWQAMPGGGDLFVQTENVKLDKDFHLPFETVPGKYVKISITDTGIGMDEKTQQRVFDPFFTTKEKEWGTGLGLASALGIVKNHGGYITAYGKPGEGSTFTIYLPVSAKKIIKKDEKPTGKILMGSGTVLIIDDEQTVLNVGKRLLTWLGYDVFTAKNGNEGLEKYRENKDKIDMVILDMIMPGMSGSDTYDALKKINTRIKVLLSTGYSLDDKAKSILDRGCSGFIQKPFNMKQLSYKVSEILTN